MQKNQVSIFEAGMANSDLIKNKEHANKRDVSEDQLNALISRNPIFFADKAITSNDTGSYTIIQMFEDILKKTRS